MTATQAIRLIIGLQVVLVVLIILAFIYIFKGRVYFTDSCYYLTEGHLDKYYLPEGLSILLYIYTILQWI